LGEEGREISKQEKNRYKNTFLEDWKEEKYYCVQ